MDRLISIILCLIVPYAILSFVEAQVNCLSWHWVSRLVYLIGVGWLLWASFRKVEE